jgi:hypothetical protein
MKIAALGLVLLFVFVATGIFHAQAGTPINFIGYKQRSGPIFSQAGTTSINYQLYAQYTGIHKPGGGSSEEGFINIVVRGSSNNVLYSYSIPDGSVPAGFGGHTQSTAPYLLIEGTFSFRNPTDENVTIEEQIWYNRPVELIAGFAAQEWSEALGQSLVSGGDRVSALPPPPPPAGGSGAGRNIHAVIISGRSDPAKIVTSPNVTLTGGVIALGKDPSPPAKPTAQWSSGLRIVPDEALLTGAKIPPLTPNIIDVRIVKHEVTGDLLTPAQ